MEGKRNWAYLEDPISLSTARNNGSIRRFSHNIPTQNQEFSQSNGDKKVRQLWRILILLTIALSIACIALGIFIALFLQKGEGNSEIHSSIR